MMRIKKLCLVTIVALWCSIAASAFTVDGISYSITSETDLTVEVTRNYSNEYSGVITIPSTLTYNGKTYSVTSIEDRAFYGCSLLTDVTIGNSVTEIGAEVFRNCTALESIIIPNTTIAMGGGMFCGCKSLTNVVIGNSVESIENDTFFGCSALANVIVGNAVKSIGSRAFYNCTALTKIALPSVTTIWSEAFHGCSSLDTVVIPKSVTDINSNAFKDCTADLYLDCNIPDEAYWFQNSSFKKVVIGENVTTIGAHAFQNCNSIVSLTMGKNVESIGVRAFEGCEGIASILIPKGITSIPNMVFLGCTHLKELIIEDCDIPLSLGSNDYSYPGEGQFSDSPLEKIYIGRDLEYNSSIYYGYSPFNDVDSIETVIVGNHVTSLGENLFRSCNVDTLRLLNLNPPFANPFNTSIYQGTVLDVPYGTLDEYRNAEVWKEFEHTRESGDFYTLIYMIDGHIYAMDSIASGVPIHLISPTKEGYTFSGWSEVPETMPANDITIYGSFAINKYLVTFKIGDELIASYSLEYGASIVTPEAPEKEGYTFNGWGEDETVPAGDGIYEGNYSVNTYKLTFIVDDEVVQELSVDYGATITLPEAPEKEGYSFDGWSEIPETMSAIDVTISGTFTVNKYLVTFKVGDEIVQSEYLEYGTKIVVPEALEKEGYTFDGWGEVAKTVPANDLTYEGSYSVNSYKLTYMIDGEMVGEAMVPYGTVVGLMDMPAKEGYTFSGWSETLATMPARDVTISGTFSINTYLVTFKIGDEVVKSEYLEYGAEIIVPEAPEKEGYTFDGWGEVGETVPAGDVIYEGSYTVNTYKVYYYVGQELVYTEEVDYGEVIPEYVYKPESEDGVFAGWEGEVYTTMPAHDVTYTAKIDKVDASIDPSTLNPQHSTEVYDLSGRRVLNTENLKGGVYIIDGQRVVVK